LLDRGEDVVVFAIIVHVADCLFQSVLDSDGYASSGYFLKSGEAGYRKLRKCPGGGGIIIDAENEEAYSLMQVLFYPLDYFGRPGTVITTMAIQAIRVITDVPWFLLGVVKARDCDTGVSSRLHLGDVAGSILHGCSWLNF
jgi:hypothetical protein